ncbi:DUF4333 domain-containing protein [Streptomyces sp. NBC_00286]|uniref:DUF4333 domain-containing protein n=1 Tax=Streptomyces sp. NBC_00286 TaxID=2975701 RepID=UPI003FA765C4
MWTGCGSSTRTSAAPRGPRQAWWPAPSRTGWSTWTTSEYGQYGQQRSRACPEHLPARVGATIRCKVTAGTDIRAVTVTTTAVNGKQVSYNIKVDASAA